jgi:ArsR family transcriptional regulator
MEAVVLFRALADQTRLRCIFLLALGEELCVCELTHALGLPQPKVSHHLSNLRKAGLVSDRKSGLWVYYRLNPELPAWVLTLIQATAQEICAELPFAADHAALQTMPNHSSAPCCA